MRLDKYLKNSRIIKRRTVAKEACDGGRISINNKIAKASDDVKIDDILEVRFGNSTFKCKVTKILESAKKDDAALMYEVIN
ncbi:ribosomal 50S subunit-recycling heat shock protein [Peptoniphilus koenoeneniae]|uniref:RQC P-site tRNA stabilizing factor n=1 Tax=Peptoniphilus koenoeneniae TaxID=507751 RepID=A0ABU0ASU7_9FIRM|nr:MULTISPECIES: RNA-binding S4 domain-containing protein [Peptoniphilus]ERT56792.1 S4 domain protein [Peptoniphilus sp. BV3C26]MDQ0274095.1 ribosomal 50S subunit-recycling heat shock protein [Peptoniphilus koenoeneniae]